MLKAVITKPGCPTLPILPSATKASGAPVFLESSSNVDNNADLVTTKVLSHQPFFQNPHTQKIQNLESELRSILESHMSDSQKALLYQSALREILRADRSRKIKPKTPLRRRPPRRPQLQNPPRRVAGVALAPVQGQQLALPPTPPPQPPPPPPPAPPLQPQVFHLPPIPGEGRLTTPPGRKRPLAEGSNPRRPHHHNPHYRPLAKPPARKKLQLGEYPEVTVQVSPRKLRTTRLHNYSDVKRRSKPPKTQKPQEYVDDEDTEEGDLYS